MDDEEIIKRRLMLDGDGTGDDRRLNELLKQILEWINSKDTSLENNQIIYDRICAQVAKCELAAAKDEHTIEMLEEELRNEAKRNEEIEQNIKLAGKKLEESKNLLAKNKVIKKNRDREEISGGIETLKKEIDELTDFGQKLNEIFEERSKDFTLLSLTINELKKSLEKRSAESDQSDDANPTRVGGVNLKDFDDDDDDVPSTSKALEKMLKTKATQKEDNVGDEEQQQQIAQSKELHQQQQQVTVMEKDAILELSLDKDEIDAFFISLEEGDL